MNTTRRNFFKTLLTSAAGFSILPPATTYERVWRAEKKLGWIYRYWDDGTIRLALSPEYQAGLLRFIQQNPAGVSRHLRDIKLGPPVEESTEYVKTMFFGRRIV